MGLDVLLGIIAVICCVLVIREEFEYSDIGTKIWVCIYVPVVAAIIWGVAVVVIALFLGIFSDKHYEKSRTVEIVAMGDKSSAGGTFFLGCGSIKSDSYYFYYEKTPSGGYKQGKIETEDAIIYEKDSISKPFITFFIKKFNNKWWDDWAICTNDEIANIFIPKGSIQQNFTLDLN